MVNSTVKPVSPSEISEIVKMFSSKFVIVSELLLLSLSEQRNSGTALLKQVCENPSKGIGMISLFFDCLFYETSEF